METACDQLRRLKEDKKEITNTAKKSNQTSLAKFVLSISNIIKFIQLIRKEKIEGARRPKNVEHLG